MAPAMSLASPDDGLLAAARRRRVLCKGREYDAAHPENVAEPEIAQRRLGLRHLSGGRRRRRQLLPARENVGTDRPPARVGIARLAAAAVPAARKRGAACEGMHFVPPVLSWGAHLATPVDINQVNYV